MLPGYILPGTAVILPAPVRAYTRPHARARPHKPVMWKCGPLLLFHSSPSVLVLLFVLVSFRPPANLYISFCTYSLCMDVLHSILRDISSYHIYLELSLLQKSVNVWTKTTSSQLICTLIWPEVLFSLLLIILPQVLFRYWFFYIKIFQDTLGLVLQCWSHTVLIEVINWAFSLSYYLWLMYIDDELRSREYTSMNKMFAPFHFYKN